METQKLYKLLIVDDDLIVRMIHQSVFSKDFEVTLAESGKEALELLRKNKFDAVLTDIQMPDLSGIELTKVIRKTHFKNKNIIILGITGSANDKDVARNAGMNKVFTKPAPTDVIKKYLFNLCNHGSLAYL